MMRPFRWVLHVSYQLVCIIHTGKYVDCRCHRCVYPLFRRSADRRILFLVDAAPFLGGNAITPAFLSVSIRRSWLYGRILSLSNRNSCPKTPVLVAMRMHRPPPVKGDKTMRLNSTRLLILMLL